MYALIVTAFMLVLPIVSIVVAMTVGHLPFSAALLGKWFVFWAVGIRLLSAGVRQIVQPRFTAEVILGIEAAESLVLVRELGFANVAIGVVGVGSMVAPSWVFPVALAGAIFYGLAGGMHVLQAKRNRHENIAMTSDLFAATVLLVFCGTAISN